MTIHVPQGDWPVADQVMSLGTAVVVYHPDELKRRGLQTMLGGLPSVRAVLGAESIVELLGILAEDSPPIAILPSSLDSELASRVFRLAAGRGTKVLLLLESAERGEVLRVSAWPAAGFLLEQGLTADSIVCALNALWGQGVYVPTELVRELVSNSRAEGGARQAYRLTPRERSVVVLIAEGLSNKEIARKLGISSHGAKRHVANVLTKLNCANRTMAASIAIREGLVEDLTVAAYEA